MCRGDKPASRPIGAEIAEQLDAGAGQRALAAHADALDDREAFVPGAPGDPAGAGGARQRQLDRRAVLEDLDRRPGA